MAKILAQAGASLADVYNVEGSSAGINTLSSEEVQLVHEMGGTIFAERVGSEILTVNTGDLLQTVAWNLQIPSLTQTPMRILGVSVISDVGNRVTRAVVSIATEPVITAGREIPIYVWDSAEDLALTIPWVDDGAAVANEAYLRQVTPVPGVPGMMFGSDSRPNRRTPAIRFRGLTATFGAGTVRIVCQVHVAWAEIGGLSSHGLPLPGW